MKIGVLSLQGDFFEHCTALKACDVEPIQVRNLIDLEEVSGLIIPGGESTVISSMLSSSGLDKEIVKLSKKGFPIYGTCAGAIVLSKKIISEKRFEPLGLLDIVIERNWYGRQLDSFEAELEIPSLKHSLKGFFIRAPHIAKTGKNVDVLASLDGSPVFVREKNILASMFHPELTSDLFVHKLFVKEAEKFSKS